MLAGILATTLLSLRLITSITELPVHVLHARPNEKQMNMVSCVNIIGRMILRLHYH